jgi:hypothetical protein
LLYLRKNVSLPAGIVLAKPAGFKRHAVTGLMTFA